MAGRRQRTTRAWLVVVGALLTGLGYLTIFSIGLPVAVAGMLMVVAGLTGVHRQQPAVYWPVTVGLAAFFAGYALVAPLRCTSSAVATVDGVDHVAETAGTTECTNLLGIAYSGGAGYAPPLWPAVVAGGVGGLSLGWGTRQAMLRRRRVGS